MKHTLVTLFIIIPAFLHGQTITTIAGGAASGFPVVNNIPATSAYLPAPVSTCFDRNGNIFIADDNNSTVYKVDTSGQIFTIAGNGICSYCDTESYNNQVATNAQIRPGSMAIDSHGDLYILSGGNVMKLTMATGTISTVLKTGASYMALDRSDNVYLSKTGMNQVWKVNAGDTALHLIAGTGASSFSGDGGPATAATLN